MTSPNWAAQLAAALTESTPRQVGAVPVVYPLLEALQVRQTINALRGSRADIDLGRVVEVLTLNRLMSPQPLYRVGEWAAHTVIVPMFDLQARQLYDQRLGRGLDELHALLGEAWQRCAMRAIQQEGLDLSVLHWDTTSVYLEGEYDESDLAAYGHSSDQHADNLQVKLGMSVTSRERAPCLYQVLAGARADVATPVPYMQALAAVLERPELAGVAKRPVVVGDSKMITPASVAAAHRLGLNYLGPWEANQAVKAVMRSVSQAELAASELSYRPSRHFRADRPFIAYRGVWRPFSVTYAGQTYHDRALVVWSAGKHRLDENKRKTYLKRLLNRLADIQGQLNRGRYVSREYAVHQVALAQRGNPTKGLVTVALNGADRNLALSFHLDRTALAQAQALDGKYVLGTNAESMSANEALVTFKARDGIEKSYACLKGPLRVRPLYLHSDRRIEGLMFISVLALLVRALLEVRCRRAGLRLSADQVLHAFASLYATDQTFVDGSRYCQLGQLTDFQQRVLATLSFPAPTRYLDRLSD